MKTTKAFIRKDGGIICNDCGRNVVEAKGRYGNIKGVKCPVCDASHKSKKGLRIHIKMH